MSQIPIVDVEAKLNNASPFTIMEFALQEHSNIAISFSGAEDVALIDIASQIRPDIQVFCLDTGRLHPETYQFIERVRDHYKINIDILSPDGEALREFVRAKGLYSFYQDDHAECCGIRKIAPLKIKLLGLDAWITGQRKDQSPGTRSNLPVVQFDTAFARPGDSLTKYNPLANWTSQQVWDYIRAYQVPYNLLHERGFVSIGCEPCTKAIGPGQHEREGRWWWEAATKKECGLHADNEKS